MVEVNVQWKNQGFDPADFQVPVEFSSDVDRIQTHLLLVTHHLRNRAQEGLSADQVANRKDMLDRLERYANRSQFPINSMHNLRIPYFIDHEGTACAVGQLLIESGHRDFAEQVQREMNNAYLLDMPYPEIGTWADAYGFTKAELAWIQPGYPPSSTWNDLTPMGGGTNGAVNFIDEHPNQNALVIAGDFTMIDGVTCDGIALYDGQTVTAMGTGAPDGRIYDLAWHDNKLWAGGAFTNSGGANIAIWDGSTWTYEQAYIGEVYTLLVKDNKLYAGGDISHNGGALVENIIVRDGIWMGLGQGLNGIVYDLIEYQGNMIAAGAFLTSGVNTTEFIAQWDGNEFTQLGTGVGSTVRDLEINGDTLYACGDLGFFPGTPCLYQFNSTSWDTISPNWMEPSNWGPYFDEIKFVNDEMYALGEFNFAPIIGTYGNDLARVYPAGPYVIPFLQTPGGTVTDMGILNNQIVIGGTFTNLNAATHNNLGTHAVITGVVEPNPAHIEIFPNPMQDEAVVRLENGLDLEEYELKVLDLAGRQVGQGYMRDWQQFLVRREGLTTGMYILSLEKDGKRIWSERLLVH